MLLFIISAAAILATSWSGWAESRPKGQNSKKRLTVRRFLILFTGIGAVAIAATHSVTWFQSKLQPRKSVIAYLKIERVGPHCSAASVIVAPDAIINSFDLKLSFSQPIVSSAVVTGFSNDQNMSIRNSEPIDGKECKVEIDPSDSDGGLRFDITTAKHEIHVSGSDFSYYDSRSILFTLFSYMDSTPVVKASGQAQFQGDGSLIPADVVLLDNHSHLLKLKADWQDFPKLK